MFIHRRGGRAALVGAALTALSVPAALAAQNADGNDKAVEAAAVARADSVRATLVQPPGNKPHPAASLVRAPFRAFGGLLAAVGGVGYGAYAALDKTGALRVARNADRDLRKHDVKVKPAYIGNRSGGALAARWNGGALPLFAEVGYSLRGYALARGGLSFGDTLYGADVSAGYHRLTQVHFWGIGPDSRTADRADYGYTTKDVTASGRARLAPHVRVGLEGGWEQDAAIHPTDKSNPDLTKQFAAALPFGAVGTERFSHVEGTVDVDFTQVGPTFNQLRGARLIAGWSGYRGLSSTNAGFQVGTGDLRLYVPVSKQHAFALRGLAQQVFAQSGSGVPIYLMPALGSSQGLRGQKSFRYRDLAMLAAQGEWRYQVWWHPGDPHYRLDAFAFVDHGAVGPSLRALAADDFITTPGIGLRFMSHGRGKVETFLAFGGDKPRAGFKLGTTF